jgi:hypothetical protein
MLLCGAPILLQVRNVVLSTEGGGFFRSLASVFLFTPFEEKGFIGRGQGLSTPSDMHSTQTLHVFPFSVPQDHPF